MELAGSLLLLLGAGVALAPSAAAADDLTRPDYTVTHGPSCHPGGVEIQVVAGTVPYHVVLATTRHPEGEDAADLAPGETVRLHTGDVDWGETIDSRLEFTALDGSRDAFADDLVPYSFTRPSEEDCAAIAPPLAAGTPAPMTVPGTDAGPAGDVPAPDGAPASGAPPAGVPASGGALRVAAARVPVAPVTRGPDWALLAAGGSLVGTAGGLVVAGARRGRRPGPTAGA